VAKGLKPGSEEAAAAAAAAAKQADSPEMAAMLAIDSNRAHTAGIRVQVRGY
jgi:chitodextrinase